MRVLLRLLLWLVGIVVGLVLLLLLSIPADALIGRGRLDPLVNTNIANPNGPEVRAFVARPSTPGPHPAVVMVHEWWGLNAEIVGKAQALADEGYVVVAPDTFRGSTTGWIPRAIYQVSTTPPEQVNSDLDAVFTWLAAQPDVRADRIGVMGFCYGGRTSLRYSIHNPAVAATAIFYGMAETTPEQLGRMPPTLGIFGEADTSIPLAEVQTLEANLRQAGVPTRFNTYPNQPHAFVKSIEEIRQGGVQQEAWNELLGFLRITLQEGRRDIETPPMRGDPGFSPVTLLGSLHHRFVCGW
ncbi:MAG: dienelactone hydrolase family protein [Chloroflexaceae bacterium]|jgi:carboxymethylenebutenolidase|nr:dienelactone hydrolase family protein [Chloroflexaceae bacterium]